VSTRTLLLAILATLNSLIVTQTDGAASLTFAFVSVLWTVGACINAASEMKP
jgi:hypothetical protein